MRPLGRFADWLRPLADRFRRFPPDFEPAEIEDIRAVQPYTMTTPERLVALIRAVHYLMDHDIPGDFVECGVWKGGSMMAIARTLRRRRACERHLWLFDTFTGMPPPTAADVSLRDEPAERLLRTHPSLRCEADLASVRAAVLATGYPAELVHFVVGRVEETIPAQAPSRIALLRLDTDWYESTRHELEHLFPRVVHGGVLLVDDYGHWRGARRAVDEYLQTHRVPLLLNRIDYSARIGVKLGGPTLGAEPC